MNAAQMISTLELSPLQNSQKAINSVSSIISDRHFETLSPNALRTPYISVFTGDSYWRTKSDINNIIAQRKVIRELLHKHPPDIVIVEQDVSNGYGFHARAPEQWPFVCITKRYVDWWLAFRRRGSHYHQLALEATLKGTLDHEFAHWFFTLVCWYV